VKQRTVNSGMLLYVSGFRRLQLCEKFFSSFFYEGAYKLFKSHCCSNPVDFFHRKSNKCVESVTQHGEFFIFGVFRRSIESVDFTDYLKCN